MKLLLDSRTYQLRGVFSDDVDVNIAEEFVELPTYRIQDLNESTAILVTVDGKTPPGMTKDDLQCWKIYNWVYNPDKKVFVKVRL